ncbi:MAG TPA: DUF1566 domain-containing protein [Candidatus Uhrbacteria bacterium]|nr:DUF1566 domain-containing protein [Candidatus Uhrbacteria bacterium]
MVKENKIKYFFLAVLACLIVLGGFKFVLAQDILGIDVLLREYLFPISSYEKSGTPESKRGLECGQFAWDEGNNNYSDFYDCKDLPNFGAAGKEVTEWLDGAGVLARKKAKFTYTFNVTRQANYVFKLDASNDADNFSRLSRQQIDYIYNDLNITLEGLLNYIGEDITADDLAVLGTSESLKYELMRNLVFSVYLNGEKKGFVFAKATAPNQRQETEIVIGNLLPGEHTIELRFLSDYYYDFSAKELPAYLANFSNADLDEDKILDINPVIHSVAIDSIMPSDDVIGIRIYQNKENKDINSWYNESVINPSSAIEPMTIDGYEAIKDDRTVYVNAANLMEFKVCQGGADDGKECESDENCSETCQPRKFFYTNVYVIAYNQAAAPSTINIFNQMLDNWQFNINLDPIEKDIVKEKLRRDVRRLADLRIIRELLENYKARHGKYPALDAGTFVKNHTISTWPSWQATLGNELGSALPTDPFNIMATEPRGPYDCSDPIERQYCQNICSRDNAGNALTGCPANQQCVGNEYCSICPAPYDEKTCWDEVNLRFAYSELRPPACGDFIAGSFNLGGTLADQVQSMEDCIDGAFVYQYTALDIDGDGQAGDAYLLNYRLEYTERDICAPGQCIFGNRCYQPGSCLAECGYVDGELVCAKPDFKNLYCLFGSWISSCGDGFVQESCGETCDPARPLEPGESWCDHTYGEQNWYNEGAISGSCSPSCRLETVEDLGYVPPPYSADPTILSCGGYCGDKIIQRLAGEQCDEGLFPGPVRGDGAGVAQDSQYRCSGSQGGQPVLKEATACEKYADDWWKNVENSCAALPTDNNQRVSRLGENDLLALGGFSVSYKFNVEQSSSYTFRIRTANYGDNLSSLTNDQIDYLLSLKTEGDTLYNITPDRGLDIPEFGSVSSADTRKYDLLRSLIYSVYLNGEAEQNRVGFIIVPARSQAQIQEGTISLGALSPGEHTVYLRFVGDHFYWDFENLSPPDYLNNFSNADTDDNEKIDVNPLIESVSFFSPELGVGNCKTFGGWCGDGIVQLEFGEQCDIKSYFSPSPAETVNLVKNPSFERVFSPWQRAGAEVNLDERDYFEGRYSLKIDSAAGDFWLNQSLNMFANKPYKISFRVKMISGTINAVQFETGAQAAGESWFGNQAGFTELTDQEIGGWQLYQIDSFASVQNSAKFRILFSAPNSSFYFDNVSIIPLDPSVRPQYLCGTERITGKICQYRGGYCGDGIIQSAFGETCDDRVGLICSTNADCGQTGFCANGICQSVDCNNVCKSTYCGDGIVQRPNAEGVYEICDWASDPLCSFDCQRIKMGGSCSHDATSPCNPNIDPNCRQCAANLSCTIRNFGDTETKCLGTRGSLGCKSNRDCILGYYCDLSSSRCEPEISTYLRYHPEPKTSLILPEPSSVAYDINITSCPDLRLIGLGSERSFVLDRCTGISWESADNISRPKWTYQQALEDGCGGATRLPNITELYSLVRQTNQGLFYSDKETLRLCPVNCMYDENSPSLCAECPDDNYIYWSSTCTQKADNGSCEKALAINFKYGSIEEYRVSDGFKVHCLRDSECGNGVIEEGETCEFFVGADGRLIEQEITRQCSGFDYDGGFLHCDPNTCNFKFNNCYFNSRLNQTCEEVCQGQKTLSCKSVGLNVSKIDDYYDIVEGTLEIANDATLMDIDQNGNCFVPGRQITCDYRFVDRQANCRDTGTGQLSPYRSEYSFCNCAE